MTGSFAKSKGVSIKNMRIFTPEGLGLGDERGKSRLIYSCPNLYKNIGKFKFVNKSYIFTSYRKHNHFN